MTTIGEKNRTKSNLQSAKAALYTIVYVASSDICMNHVSIAKPPTTLSHSTRYAFCSDETYPSVATNIKIHNKPYPIWVKHNYLWFAYYSISYWQLCNALHIRVVPRIKRVYVLKSGPRHLTVVTRPKQVLTIS